MSVAIHFDRDALKEYERIKVENRKLFDAVDRKLKELKGGLEKNGRPTIGEIIPTKELSSKLQAMLKSIGCKVLWKIDLPEGWRIVYSIGHDEIEIIAFVLKLGDHKEYEHFLNH